MDNLGSLFVEAGTLLLAGMVFVFAFLSLLIVFVNQVLNRLAVRYPDPVPKTAPRTPAKSKVNAKGVPENIVAAISSAVHQYRQQNKK